MKKIIKILARLFLFLILLIFIGYIINSIYFKLEQIKIAHILGVNINDYPPSQYFPQGYFLLELQSGMSIKKVHAIMKGYVSVKKCGDYMERYFFISDKQGINVLLLDLLYSEDKLLLKKIVTFDRGYNPYTPECIPGQLKPKE